MSVVGGRAGGGGLNVPAAHHGSVYVYSTSTVCISSTSTFGCGHAHGTVLHEGEEVLAWAMGHESKAKATGPMRWADSEAILFPISDFATHVPQQDVPVPRPRCIPLLNRKTSVSVDTLCAVVVARPSTELNRHEE